MSGLGCLNTTAYDNHLAPRTKWSSPPLDPPQMANLLFQSHAHLIASPNHVYVVKSLAV